MNTISIQADIGTDHYPVPNHPDLLNWITLNDKTRYAPIGERTLWAFPDHPDAWRVHVALAERDGTVVETFDTVEEAVRIIYTREVRAAKLPAKVERVRAALVRLEVAHKINIRPGRHGRFIYLHTGQVYARATAGWHQSDGSRGERRTTRWVNGYELWIHQVDRKEFTQRLALYHLRSIGDLNI